MQPPCTPLHCRLYSKKTFTLKPNNIKKVRFIFLFFFIPTCNPSPVFDILQNGVKNLNYVKYFIRVLKSGDEKVNNAIKKVRNIKSKTPGIELSSFK